MTKTIATSFKVERFTLDNGLRVVVSPDSSSPTVTVALAYDVGFRSEPEGRTGFAHLFEHLMFQGSANLGKGEFDRLIEANGGAQNGQTLFDQTTYFEVLPSNAIEIALFGEADRMVGLALNEENLQNQVDVVKEEIRVNVHNRPYGGFPWQHLNNVMFETFANSHDGYGSFADLEAATVPDAATFFDRYYSPGNAILALAGDVDPDKIEKLVASHFDRVPKRAVPKRPDFGEPPPKSEKRRVHNDPNAPIPALAIGYRVPDPVSDFRSYVAAIVLAAVLGNGQASRLYQRLVKTDRAATHVSSYVGDFGQAFWMRDPAMLEVLAYYPGPAGTNAVVTAIDEEAARVSTDGFDDDELDRVKAALVADFLWDNDQIISRALNLAAFEQVHGRAELVNDVGSFINDIRPADVVAAAEEWLDPNKRAVLEWMPGEKR